MAGQILPEEPDLVHRCRAGQRCAARTPDGSAVTTGPDTLCHTCVVGLQKQLDQLPTIKDVLRMYFVRGGESAQTRVASSSEPQPPLNVNTLDLVDEIEDALERIGSLSVDALVRQPAQQFRLWRHGDWKMDYLDGVQRALEIAHLWSKADRVIGMTRPWQQRLAKCPKCNTRTLGNFAGEDKVTCSACGGTMTQDEYQRTTIIRARTGELPNTWTAITEEELDELSPVPPREDDA